MEGISVLCEITKAHSHLCCLFVKVFYLAFLDQETAVKHNYDLLLCFGSTFEIGF